MPQTFASKEARIYFHGASWSKQRRFTKCSLSFVEDDGVFHFLPTFLLENRNIKGHTKSNWLPLVASYIIVYYYRKKCCTHRCECRKHGSIMNPSASGSEFKKRMSVVDSLV